MLYEKSGDPAGSPEQAGERRMRGVFWVIENKLHAFPFVEGAQFGVAKSGVTFNHRLLWPYVRPEGCGKPYNYFPRGRVDYTNQGKSVIYMNQNIALEFVLQIIKAFGLEEDAVVRIDRSRHYRCYLDFEYDSNENRD